MDLKQLKLSKFIYTTVRLNYLNEIYHIIEGNMQLLADTYKKNMNKFSMNDLSSLMDCIKQMTIVGRFDSPLHTFMSSNNQLYNTIGHKHAATCMQINDYYKLYNRDFYKELKFSQKTKDLVQNLGKYRVNFHNSQQSKFNLFANGDEREVIYKLLKKGLALK